MAISRAVLLALFAAGSVAAAQPQPQHYWFIDLGVINGTDSTAAAINGAGQVAGTSRTDADLGIHAVLWNGTAPIDLGTNGQLESNALALNDTGRIAGWSGSWAPGFNDARQATVWDYGMPSSLATLGGQASVAQGINDAGQVVGWSYTPGAKITHPVLWEGGTARDLGTLSGGSGEAWDVNNVGQIVGVSTVSGVLRRATLWNGGAPIDLGTLGGTESFAYAINDAGQIVGNSFLAAPYMYTVHATVWNALVAQELETAASSSSVALAINNAGLIVGSTYVTSWLDRRATLWTGTAAIDLNSLLDADVAAAGWYLRDANGINDRGCIVGLADNSVTGQSHAFLLVPVKKDKKAKAGRPPRQCVE